MSANSALSAFTDVTQIDGLANLWSETTGDASIRIAILDGPVDQTHPSLAGARLTQLGPLVPGTTETMSALSHGTHVASVIFGQHGSSVKGIAPRCHGLIVPIFGSNPDGSLATCSQLDLARAITLAVEANAHIVNISGGEHSPSGTANPWLADAVQKCVENNVLIVTSVGNDGCQCVHVPGALPSVLAVGALDAQGLPTQFSNWGQAYQVHGVLAPGQNILGAELGGTVSAQSGTSFATPIVAGVAALLLSLQLQNGGYPDPHAIRAAILESAYACDSQAVADCRPFLVGSLNIAGAHAQIKRSLEERLVGHDVARIRVSKDGSPIQSALLEENLVLKQDDLAPDFLVKDHRGNDVALSNYKGKTVVLWFYPRADTPG